MGRTRAGRSARSAGRDTGRLELTARGFGFVSRGPGQPDVFIPPGEVGDARTGDIVEVELVHAPRGPAGRNLRILDRPARRIVARALHVSAGNRIASRPYDRELPEALALENPAQVTVRAGDLLLVEVPGGLTRRAPHVLSVLGRAGDARLDSRRVAVEFGLAGDFPPDVIAEETAALRAVPDDARRDCTADLVVTMDPATAHDFDDAVSIERLPRDRFRVTVHIADVSAFVVQDGPMDREAQARGTSVYLPDGVIRMLPETLSRTAASLVESEDRPAVSIAFTVDAHGRRTQPEMFLSTIRSAARLSYEDAEEMLDGGRPAAPPLADALRAMREAADRLHAARLERGAWDMDLPETRVMLRADGEPRAVEREHRLATHRIVEEFMLAANETVGHEMARAGRPLIYRVHPEPDRVEMAAAFRLARLLGLTIPRVRGTVDDRARALLADPSGDPALRRIAHTYVLRAMERARYAVEDTGHFGLGTDGYCHFTSPIRRYPDLANHRFVREAVEGVVLSPRARHARLAHLEELARVCSEREEAAEQAERAATRVKALRWAAHRLGDEMQGIVTGIGPTGLYVELDEIPVDGRLPRGALGDDDYEVDEAHFAYVGRRSGSRFPVGMRLRVTVARVAPEEREMEFALTEPPRVGSPRERRGGGRRGRPAGRPPAGRRGKKK